MFQLSKKVIKQINNPETRIQLAQALQCTEQTIIRYINNNDDSLTKAAAMEVIRKYTGLKDNEILVRIKSAV